MLEREGRAAPPEARKANYDLASRWTPAKVGKLVFDTAVTPHWLETGNRFWYSYETAQGRRWMIVDPAARTKKPLFDNARMAAGLTRILLSPYDAQHLPIKTVKFIRKDTAIQFEVEVPKDSDILVNGKIIKASEIAKEEEKAQDQDKQKDKEKEQDTRKNKEADKAKERPADSRPDAGVPTDLDQWKLYLQRIIYPDHKLMPQHQRWIRYTLKFAVDSLLQRCPGREERFLAPFFAYYRHPQQLDDDVTFQLLDTAAAYLGLHGFSPDKVLERALSGIPGE